MSWSAVTGFVRKSMAPIRMASTAASTEPKAVTTMASTGGEARTRGAHHLQAVDRLHAQVGEHQIKGDLLQARDGRLAVVEDLDVVPFPADEQGRSLGGRPVVVHHQDAQATRNLAHVCAPSSGLDRGSSASKRAPQRRRPAADRTTVGVRPS